MKKEPRRIYAVYAADFPSEIEDWCCLHDYSTHYADSIIQIWKDDEEVNVLRILTEECVKIE